MTFEWGRIYKVEDYLETEAYTSAYDYISDFYKLEGLNDLTQEQYNEIASWREKEVIDGSIMWNALGDVLSNWEHPDDV